MAHAWKACWVQALGGSNPPSSATGPRDRFRFRGFCCLQPRLISGRRESCPPASRPRRELRSARRLEARPGPAGLAAASNRAGLVAVNGQAPPPPTGTAAGPSGALHTGGTCIAWTSPARPRRRPPAPRPGHAALAAKPRGFCGRRQSGGPALLSPGLVPLRLRGPRRSLRRGVRPGPRPSQRASIGAGPSRCSSIRPSMPSR